MSGRLRCLVRQLDDESDDYMNGVKINGSFGEVNGLINKIVCVCLLFEAAHLDTKIYKLMRKHERFPFRKRI